MILGSIKSNFEIAIYEIIGKRNKTT